MNKINVLIVGGGGREHALAWKIQQSPQCGNLYVAPGNPGTAMLGCRNISIPIIKDNFKILGDLATNLKIGLAVIGPENALANGIVTTLLNRGIPTFGPTAKAAQIESSKSFAKKLMGDVGIPTADFKVFSDNQLKAAKKYVQEKKGGVVVKADGLAFGKGVRVCHSIEESLQAIEDFMVQKTLGDAGRKVVIEDLLAGIELSIHALSDGTNVKLLPPLHDHKHLFNGNTGLMTGGMGVYGPINITTGLMEEIEKTIVLPCIRELARRNIPFVGCLYPGLMLTKKGPRVLEFNARFGDPEGPVYMRLMDDTVDFIEVCFACIKGKLNKVELKWKNTQCLSIVHATYGYPESPRFGDIVSLKPSEIFEEVIFQNGTAWSDGKLITNGGRVLECTYLIPNQSAIPLIYSHMEKDRFPESYYRKNIGMTL